MANLVVASDASQLLDALAAWAPTERGLLLSPELRAAALGGDVNARGAA